MRHKMAVTYILSLVVTALFLHVGSGVSGNVYETWPADMFAQYLILRL